MNSQPWKLQMHSEVDATLLLDTTRRPPGSDAWIYCTMGIFLETLAVVASNEGWTLQEDLLEPVGPGPLIPFAKLLLKPGVQRKSLYSNATVQRRRTMRLAHGPEPLPEEATKRLSETAADWGQRLTWITDPAAIDATIQRHIDKICSDLTVPAERTSRQRWFRYTARKARLTGDGLEGRVLNLRGWQFWILTKVPGLLRWRWIQARYRKRLGTVQAIGILSGPFSDRAAAVKAGRFLMRFWLEATRLDLALHPFGNLTASAPDDAHPDAWFVFRIGRAGSAPPSHRLRETDILLRDTLPASSL